MNLEEELMKNPLIKNPPRYVSADYENGYLIFTLSNKVTYDWVEIFNGHNYNYKSFLGYGPEKFEFNNNIARIFIGNTFNESKQLLEYFKDYLSKTNDVYKELKTKEVNIKIWEEQEKEKIKLDEKTRRDEILRQLNS